MFNIVLRIFICLIILCGIILIYDARNITKRFFGFGDQNEGTAGLKIWGFLLAIFGGLILCFFL